MGLLIGLSAALFCTFALIAFLLVSRSRSEKRFERIIAERTHECNLQANTMTTLFDSLPDIVFVQDSDLRFTHVNTAFLTHFDRKEEDVIGKTIEALLIVPIEQAERFNEINLGVIKSDQP